MLLPFQYKCSMCRLTIPTQIPTLCFCYNKSPTHGFELMVNDRHWSPAVLFSNLLTVLVKIFKVGRPGLCPMTRNLDSELVIHGTCNFQNANVSLQLFVLFFCNEDIDCVVKNDVFYFQIFVYFFD